MNFSALRKRLGLGVASIFVLASIALPLLSPGALTDAAWVVNAFVAVAATLAIATTLSATPTPWSKDAAMFFASTLLLAAATTVTAAPSTDITWLTASLAFATLYAVTTRLSALVPYGIARVFLIAAAATWVWSNTPITDAGSTVLGVVALAAPGITMHAITSRQRQAFVAAIVAWPATVLFVARIAAHAQATYDSELVAQEALRSIPAFVASSQVPVIESANMLPYLALAVAAAAVAAIAAVLARYGARTGKRSTLSIAAVLIAAVLSTTGLSQAVANAPDAKAKPLLENTIANRASMLSEAGAGPKERYRGYSFEDCDNANNRDCFITYFDNIALQQGVAPAVRMIVELVKDNVGVNFPGHCHQVVHNLGQMAMDLTGGDFGRVSDIDPQVCGTGFTHGLWELNFNRIGAEAMFTKTGLVCEELGMVNDWYRWTCSHILGHMMMTESMESPALAMEYCLKIPYSINRSDCLAGGWMNYFQDDYVLEYFRSGKGTPQDLFEICYGAKVGVVKIFCYQELFPVIYSIADGDDLAAGKMCVELAEKPGGTGRSWDVKTLDFADRCVQGLARAIAVSSQYDYRAIPSRCNAMPEQVRAPCLASAAASVVLNTGSQSGGVKVCDAVVDDLYRGYCVFWAKNSQRLLAQGPNAARDLPRDNETRLPGLGSGVKGSETPATPAP